MAECLLALQPLMGKEMPCQLLDLLALDVGRRGLFCAGSRSVIRDGFCFPPPGEPRTDMAASTLGGA